MRHYNNFEDHFETFPLYRGRLADDDEDDDSGRVIGKFKVSYKTYATLNVNVLVA